MVEKVIYLRGQVNVVGEKKMVSAFIGIGSNLGDPLAQCRRAVDELGGIPQTAVVSCSSFYQSEPLVPEGESPEGIPLYMNAVCRVETGLKPLDLLKHLQRLEKKLGRVKRSRWASREIDLDLLSYDDRVVHEDGITIPHPELHKRGFVIKPLGEIAPDWVHPLLGKSVAEMEKNLEVRLKVRKIEKNPY